MSSAEKSILTLAIHRKPVSVDPRETIRDVWFLSAIDKHEHEPPLKHILAVVSKESHIAKQELVSRRRGSPWAIRARFAYYFVARKVTSKSFPQIAKACGDRDHTSVMNGCHRVATNWQKYEPLIKAVTARLGVG